MRHFVNTLSDAVGGSQRSSMHGEITLVYFGVKYFIYMFRVWGLRSTRALGQLSSPTGDFPKQTSLCIAALATVGDGAQTNIVAVYVAISTVSSVI